MSKFILALDQGTTSSRAILFSHDGQIVSMAQQEFPQILPAPGIDLMLAKGLLSWSVEDEGNRVRTYLTKPKV